MIDLLTNPYAILSAILVASFGGYIRYRSAKKGRLASASAVFRSAFSITLSDLRNGTDETHTILERQFPAHETSVLEFAMHLNYIKSKCFMKAWYGYYCQDGDPSIPFLGQYSAYIGSAKLAEENRALAIQRIEHLLSYAKQT